MKQTNKFNGKAFTKAMLFFSAAAVLVIFGGADPIVTETREYFMNSGLPHWAKLVLSAVGTPAGLACSAWGMAQLRKDD